MRTGPIVHLAVSILIPSAAEQKGIAGVCWGRDHTPGQLSSTPWTDSTGDEIIWREVRISYNPGGKHVFYRAVNQAFSAIGYSTLTTAQRCP